MKNYCRRLLDKFFYHDRATVRRAVKVTEDCITEFENVIVYEDLPCALHQYGKTLYAHRDDRAQKISEDLRLCYSPEFEILENDTIEVKHLAQVFVLIAGTEFAYPTHKELSLRRRKESGQV